MEDKVSMSSSSLTTCHTGYEKYSRVTARCLREIGIFPSIVLPKAYSMPGTLISKRLLFRQREHQEASKPITPGTDETTVTDQVIAGVPTSMSGITIGYLEKIEKLRVEWIGNAEARL